MNGIQIWMGISASQSKVYIVLKFKKWIWMEMAKYQSMNLIVNAPGAARTLQVDPTDTVEAVKLQVEESTGIPASAIALSHQGQCLDDVNNLADYGVQELASLDLTVPLLGGKVHGSLARAGKVRGQTPKVAKQDKKKKKTGRAKRRIQYNRRFVNVVAGAGKKRGPNSNS